VVAVKSHNAAHFLQSCAAAGDASTAVLLYGTDPGLVAERAAWLAKRWATRSNPPGEVLRFDDASLDADPERLAVELLTPAMFGGRKIVRASAGRRITAALLRPLLEASLEGSLIVEAGSLRPDDALRVLFEKSAGAAAIACFPDTARELDGLIGDVLGAAHLDITPEAKRLLAARLGADRALSRAEIEKLALYAHGTSTIAPADVEAAVGDAAELALDDIALAAAAGDARAALAACEKTLAAGESAQTVITAVQRHFLRLHRLAAALEAGRSLEEAMRQLRPPPAFKHKEALERQCLRWSRPALDAALRKIFAAARRARQTGALLEAALAERLLLELAGEPHRPPTVADGVPSG
jgi:DNA polymerase-3 subunit delta